MNPLEIGLSFLEGLALIASPCILPVLPLILSTSVDGGRRRPFGIIAGFVCAFSLFALLSRELVAVFHFNLDYIKYGSLVLLAVFGIMMLSETLSAKFSYLTQFFATQGTTLSAKAKDGFLSGILIGGLIGLVWTPCAGPILAVVLVQIIRQQNNLSAILLIVSFALGAGLPMLIIALTGRKLMTRLKFLTIHAQLVRKLLGVLIIIAVIFIASGFNPQNLFATTTEASSTQPVSTRQLQNALAKPYPAPEFAPSNIWLNTPDNRPLSISLMKGKVVLVDFWTYSCINCIRTLPYINDWYSKYHTKGLEIIGVHAPEFEFEKNKANVIQAIAQDGIHYPVAMDNNLDTWTNFHNQYWPAHYLINQKGEVVYTHFGEGQYQETENNIQVLLGLSVNGIKDSSDKTVTEVNPEQTPETYLGYERAEAFNSPEKIVQDANRVYTLPVFLPGNTWALSGLWRVEGQRIIASSINNKLELNFTAKHVYLVLGNSSGMPITLSLKLNGKVVGEAAGHDAQNGIVTVDGHRLYELINQAKPVNGLLEIDVSKPGVEAYAFTFG